MPLKFKERDIQKTCEDYLRLDGWRLLRMEQNFSEKKIKTVGERGMPDLLAIRYSVAGIPQSHSRCVAEVMWWEWKQPNGRVGLHQLAWHFAERVRGAMTLIAGEDFEASIEGFLAWYRKSGLNRRPI